MAELLEKKTIKESSEVGNKLSDFEILQILGEGNTDSLRRLNQK